MPADEPSPSRKILVLGSTGLLGQAVAEEIERRGLSLRAAARRAAPIPLDIADDAALAQVLDREAPDMVVNCAAAADIDVCERDPLLAWRTNARPLSILAGWSATARRPLVHVSTDQYFLDGGSAAHDEAAPVAFVNEYARSKFAGEAFALTSPHALVLRTALVGTRGWERPTFGEWAIDVALHDRPATLFSDAFTSAIDVASFARAALDLVDVGARGLLNLAAREVYSKEAFVREVARQLGRTVGNVRTGSVASLGTRRANALGLDVRRAEAALGYRLPVLRDVVAAMLAQHRRASGA